MNTQQMDKNKILQLHWRQDIFYTQYPQSWIASDARDGLKPVHRRILYAMDQLNYILNQTLESVRK